jgi:hypothetical protein
MTEAKAYRSFINVYALSKSEWLSANIKLALHKAQIRSLIIYAYPAWEFASDTRLLKLELLQNKVLCTIGKFPRCTPVCELHMAFQVLLIYDYIQNCTGNKQSWQKIIKMQMFMTSGNGKPITENIRGLSLVWSSMRLFKRLGSCCKKRYMTWGIICCAKPRLKLRLTEALYILFICTYCIYQSHVKL